MSGGSRVLLPILLRPIHYCVRLEPDLQAFTFKGEVEIDVDVVTRTRVVILHACELTIQSARFTSNSPAALSSQVFSTELNEKDETLSLTCEEALAVGGGKLFISFEGILNDRMQGFYRSRYQVNGETRYIATTQFEATDARRAFPCWDEPMLKATFDVTLVTPTDRVAISNMQVAQSTTGGDGRRVVRFARTPVMSTYLLAFVVGELDFVAGTTPEGVHVRVYTPLGKSDQGTFALHVGMKTLSFFTSYFGIPYPFSKIDMLAIPDLSAGAMENWGCVTFREYLLLVDAALTCAAIKQDVAEFVAHELAHQWFGNLVTMEWWTHLLLNEGFATWAAFLAVDHVFPEWDVSNQFLSTNVNSALRLDALRSSHPIEVEVRSAAEIGEIFDDISYNKGASVIRMLASFVGHEPFRQALQMYLKRHAYSNASTDDLWTCIAEVSGQPINAMMHSWTKQTGYPVVSMVEHASADVGTRVFDLQQTRFLADGQAQGAEAEAAVRWWVPVTFSTAASSHPVLSVLHEPSQRIAVPVPSSSSFIKVNSGQHGLYRVRYPPDLLQQLVPAISQRLIPAVDRLGVETDTFALAKARMIATEEYLRLLTAYTNEDDYTVWTSIVAHLDDIASLLEHLDCYAAYKRFILSLFQNIFHSIGWDAAPGESHLRTLLRTLVLRCMVRYGNPDAIAEVRRRLNLLLSDPSAVPADLRSVLYTGLVQHGGEVEYEQVWELMTKTDLHEERLRCIAGLAAASTAPLINRTLAFSLSDNCKPQDTGSTIAAVAQSLMGRTLAWDFFKERFDSLMERYGKQVFTLGYIIGSICSSFASNQSASEMEAFFTAHPVDVGKRAIEQAIEAIRTRSLWLAANEQNIDSFLRPY